MQKETKTFDFTTLKENGIGHYIRMNREAKGYSQLDICDGICSIPMLSLIEKGEKTADYWMAEALLERMKIEKTECEFVLDDATCNIQMHREAIVTQIQGKEYREAEENLTLYQEKYGGDKFHDQFLFFQKASLERARPKPDNGRKKELFLKALTITAPGYKEIIYNKGVMSNLELECIAEIIHCIEDLEERASEYKNLYEYFQWNCKREGFFPPAYRIAMQYNAECLYESGKLEECIQACNMILEELRGTSKVTNRVPIFFLRAKAREAKGPKTEEEKRDCMKDYLTVYTVISFYDGEKETEALKKYIEEEYGWQFTD
ncbi:MAG: hypothetical protein K2O03_04030 [Lachnospiraceae bacterium]|nr:hypothetical protein [Lachnospiraceae bacterium]